MRANTTVKLSPFKIRLTTLENFVGALHRPKLILLNLNNPCLVMNAVLHFIDSFIFTFQYHLLAQVWRIKYCPTMNLYTPPPVEAEIHHFCNFFQC